MYATDEDWRSVDDLGPGVRTSPVPAAAPDCGVRAFRAASYLRVSALAAGVAVTVWLVRRRRVNTRGGAGGS